MTFLQLLFYVFAAFALFGAFMVVVSKSPVQSVLFLVFTFFATAGIWMLLHAEFLSLILVLVYVGAVMTLFLFVVMMLSVHIETLREGFVRYLPFGMIVVGSLIAVMIAAIGPHHLGIAQMPLPASKPEDYNNIANLGMTLFTNYTYPFEIAAVVLLTAIVAAISLAYRPPRKRKSQNISQQIAVKPADRVRLVNMTPEGDK